MSVAIFMKYLEYTFEISNLFYQMQISVIRRALQVQLESVNSLYESDQCDINNEKNNVKVRNYKLSIFLWPLYYISEKKRFYAISFTNIDYQVSAKLLWKLMKPIISLYSLF